MWAFVHDHAKNVRIQIHNWDIDSLTISSVLLTLSKLMTDVDQLKLDQTSEEWDRAGQEAVVRSVIESFGRVLVLLLPSNPQQGLLIALCRCKRIALSLCALLAGFLFSVGFSGKSGHSSFHKFKFHKIYGPLAHFAAGDLAWLVHAQAYPQTLVEQCGSVQGMARLCSILDVLTTTIMKDDKRLESDRMRRVHLCTSLAYVNALAGHDDNSIRWHVAGVELANSHFPPPPPPAEFMLNRDRFKQTLATLPDCLADEVLLGCLIKSLTAAKQHMHAAIICQFLPNLPTKLALALLESARSSCHDTALYKFFWEMSLLEALIGWHESGGCGTRGDPDPTRDADPTGDPKDPTQKQLALSVLSSLMINQCNPPVIRDQAIFFIKIEYAKYFCNQFAVPPGCSGSPPRGGAGAPPSAALSHTPSRKRRFTQDFHCW